jgi:hypothetical protein
MAEMLEVRMVMRSIYSTNIQRGDLGFLYTGHSCPSLNGSKPSRKSLSACGGSSAAVLAARSFGVPAVHRYRRAGDDVGRRRSMPLKMLGKVACVMSIFLSISYPLSAGMGPLHNAKHSRSLGSPGHDFAEIPECDGDDRVDRTPTWWRF